MTFDIDAKPESPRLQLFGRVGAYFLSYVRILLEVRFFVSYLMSFLAGFEIFYQLGAMGYSSMSPMKCLMINSGFDANWHRFRYSLK